MSAHALLSLQDRLHRDALVRAAFETRPLSVLADYDLTEDETRELVLPNFSWFLAGKIAGCARPRTPDAMDMLYALGVRALISVTVGPLSPDLLAHRELPARHFSVEDAPTLEQVDEAIATIARSLENGRPIAVHCDAGLGRTGTILACYLVSEGLSAPAAISIVRARRPGSIELPEQEEVIAHYEHHRVERRSGGGPAL